jgi:outer membrane protein
MKICKKLFFAGLIVLFGSFHGVSQEVAYVNSLVVINSMQEAKVAQQQLEQYRKALNNEYDMKVNAFQTRLAEAQQKEVETDIGNEEQQLRKLESESVQKIKEKENSLYQPIYEKANAAISNVAKAAGFKLVLDSSAGIVLYADTSTDLTQRVVDVLK